MIYEDLISANLSYNMKDKSKNISQNIRYMLARSQSMFHYENLPETVPQRNLELYLQIFGQCVFTMVDNKYYVFHGALGGELNEYYEPTIFTVSNPRLNFFKNLEIGKDCILCYNDSLYMGLYPIYSKYSTMLCENELSIHIAQILTRLTSVLSATDDRTKKSIEHMITEIIDGSLSVIYDDDFIDSSFKATPFNKDTHNIFTQLIELQQYLKASMFNEIGLDSNYNMKRESLNSAESQLNYDSLIPLIDDMLESRQKCVEKINEKYGLSISVDLSSVWKEKKEKIKKESEENENKENANGDIS